MTDALCFATRFDRQFCGLPAGHAEPHQWQEPPTFGDLARASGLGRRPGEGFSDYQRRVLDGMAAQ